MLLQFSDSRLDFIAAFKRTYNKREGRSHSLLIGSDRLGAKNYAFGHRNNVIINVGPFIFILQTRIWIVIVSQPIARRAISDYDSHRCDGVWSYGSRLTIVLFEVFFLAKLEINFGESSISVSGVEFRTSQVKFIDVSGWFAASVDDAKWGCNLWMCVTDKSVAVIRSVQSFFLPSHIRPSNNRFRTTPSAFPCSPTGIDRNVSIRRIHNRFGRRPKRPAKT